MGKRKIAVNRVEVDYRVNDPDPTDIMVTENQKKETYSFENGPTPAQYNECFKKLKAHARARNARLLTFWVRDGFLISDPKPRHAGERKRSKP